MSTYAQICYGIAFDEGYEFPWDIVPWFGDHEAWWRDVNDYEPLEYPYASNGGYKPGVDGNDPRAEEYYNHKENWIEENPLPITIVDCGYDGEVILAVSSSLIVAYDAKAFRPVDLVELSVKERVTLRDFCQRWNIESDEPKWWLSTYKG